MGAHMVRVCWPWLSSLSAAATADIIYCIFHRVHRPRPRGHYNTRQQMLIRIMGKSTIYHVQRWAVCWPEGVLALERAPACQKTTVALVDLADPSALMTL